MDSHLPAPPQADKPGRTSRPLAVVLAAALLLAFGVFVTAESPYFETTPGPLCAIPVAVADDDGSLDDDAARQAHWRFTTVYARQLTWGEALTTPLFRTAEGTVVRAEQLVEDESRVELSDQMAASTELASALANQRVPDPLVEVRITSAVGSSAGLMATLAALDAKDRQHLSAGRVIAGTGTIDASGDILPVLSVDLKVEAAAAGGADLFLAPPGTTDATRVGTMEIVEVASLDETLDLLCADAPEAAACTY